MVYFCLNDLNLKKGPNYPRYQLKCYHIYIKIINKSSAIHLLRLRAFYKKVLYDKVIRGSSTRKESSILSFSNLGKQTIVLALETAYFLYILFLINTTLLKYFTS